MSVQCCGRKIVSRFLIDVEVIANASLLRGRRLIGNENVATRGKRGKKRRRVTKVNTEQFIFSRGKGTVCAREVLERWFDGCGGRRGDLLQQVDVLPLLVNA